MSTTPVTGILREPGNLRVRRLRQCGLLLIAILLQTLPATRADEQDVETRIKAAFLYHFCNYIDWPENTFADTDSPLTIGVVGSERMTRELREVVRDRLAHNRPIVVRQVTTGDSLEGLQMLFISRSATASMRRLVASANALSLLVVTEDPAGLDTGSVINFIVEDDRVRFDISTLAVQQRNLAVSAQLLTVARVIRENGE